jgi:hypothetical protein
VPPGTVGDPARWQVSWTAALRHAGPPSRVGGAMRHEGLTVFVLFFGLALLDAIADGQWLRAAFWLALGVGFALLDRRGDRRRFERRSGAHPFWV